MRIIAFALAVTLLSGPAGAALPTDPLASPMWDYVGEQVFGAGAVVRFDQRLKVSFPDIAENQRVFPVAIDARAFPGATRIILFSDLNPIQLALDYRPQNAEPFVATRIKLDQRTPVRGAAQLADGSWVVSGGWIDAAGGGCSAPPVSRVKGDWSQHLGEVRGRAWPQGAVTRLRLAFRHPMDTGFVDNISSYHIDGLQLTSASGKPLGRLSMQASVSEDPVLTLMPRVAAGDTIILTGRDTNGVAYDGRIAVPNMSAMPAPVGAGN